METNKPETLEEAAEKFRSNNPGTMQGGNNTKILNAFIAGAKWQAERMYSEEEIFKLIQDIINEIEVRKQNIISNSEKMEIHLLEGGCMAFESSQDVVKEWFEQFKKK